MKVTMEKTLTDIEREVRDGWTRHMKQLQANSEGNIFWTYVMYDGTSELSKIGKSRNPYQRERDFHTASPATRVVLMHKDNKEKELHERFKEKWRYGEWYELSEDDYTDLVYYDGFRFAQGNLVPTDDLYCVAEEELSRKAPTRKLDFDRFPQYMEMLSLHRNYGGEFWYWTHVVKKANEIGLRTPQGFKWTVEFARAVDRQYRNQHK